MDSRWRKPSKYFCGLESLNYSSKIIPKIVKDNGKIIINQKDILKEVELFYNNLYSENKNLTHINLNAHLQSINVAKLTNSLQ